jgi:hypothetical protein
MTPNEALLISLRAAYRRWQADAKAANYATDEMPWAVLTPAEMAALRATWPDIKGTQGNSVLPNVLRAAINALDDAIHEPVDETGDDEFLDEDADVS